MVIFNLTKMMFIAKVEATQLELFWEEGEREEVGSNLTVQWSLSSETEIW
jgi:hypothetical protein